MSDSEGEIYRIYVSALFPGLYFVKVGGKVYEVCKYVKELVIITKCFRISAPPYKEDLYSLRVNKETNYRVLRIQENQQLTNSFTNNMWEYMKNFKGSVYFKMISIFIIVLFLMIPAFMIENLIHEREETQKQAIREVSSIWSNEQTISGPILTIPYLVHEIVTDKDNKEKRMISTEKNIHILPLDLKYKGLLKPEKRYRSIYEVVVYETKLEVSGVFSSIDFKKYDIPYEDIKFDKAYITMGIDDLRGIEKQIQLNWKNTEYLFEPGVLDENLVSSGINSLVDVSLIDSVRYNFNFTLDIKGSQRLYFTPLGITTDIKLNSTWSNPSFNGAFLPDSRNVSEQGFEAHWNVLNLNRNYPQVWDNVTYPIAKSAFGIDLLIPIDNYQKTYRSIKYAILFIGFTFLAFFFIEVLNKVFIHPIQYILVGISLVIFYILLLSISEHLVFNLAYLISAGGTILLIAGYLKAVLKSFVLTSLISSILLILYSFLFIIIQLQDYALLFGSIGIFLILGIVMYFSRKIDWYALNQRNQQ